MDAEFKDALWRIFNQPERPVPWADGGNLPWDDPQFSKRMLREHLDESHGAASRVAADRELQIDWLWERLVLKPGCRLLDLTCGPGLYAVEFARRGCHVTGVDFSPAAIEYANGLARQRGVSDRCHFVQEDVREVALDTEEFDAAIFIFGQLSVFRREEASDLLAKMAVSLKPSGRLAVELHDPVVRAKVAKRTWSRRESGLWGESPYLHLAESLWLVEESMTVSRFFTVHLDTGRLEEVMLCDIAYTPQEMIAMMEAAGFTAAFALPGWDGLPLSDAGRWTLYLAER